MSSQGIEWLDEEAILDAVLLLQEQYAGDPIGIINLNPIGYIANLAAVSHYYDSDLLTLAAVIGRSIIQGHPLQDGNKRLGILLMTLFLSENGLRLQANEKEITETALSLAQGTLDSNGLRSWLEAHTCQEKIATSKEG